MKSLYGALKRNSACGRCTMRNVGTSMWLIEPMPVFTQSTGSRAAAEQAVPRASAPHATIQNAFFPVMSQISFFAGQPITYQTRPPRAS